MRLEQDFYQRDDVLQVSRDLLGKLLITRTGGVVTGGIIVETEAYSYREKGCHAYGYKRTPRTSVMFEDGGIAYVYLCYGMHHLFNVVTNVKGIPEAVLIRALEPSSGVEFMRKRRGQAGTIDNLTSGPGRLTKSLGIDRSFNGKALTHDEIWVETIQPAPARDEICAGPRVGIDYAGADARLPWRFYLRNNKWVSKGPVVADQ